ncbi:MAG: electron transport complex subunit RsxC [Clostridia bacterium]|nr:electron transport complex subunit RsxC [Clostridia bacterium]
MKPVCRAKGGVHPPHNKFTAVCETVNLPLPKTVTIPLAQHIGAPCLPLVQVGDSVFVGTLLADRTDALCAPIHSSVSGVVTAIEPTVCMGGRIADAVVIETDGKQIPDPSLTPRKVTNANDLVAAARACGLVGLGGAGFPTHIKLKPSKDQPIDVILINAAECEPYITSDDRACIEDTALIVRGIYTLLDALSPKRVIVGIERNKPKAIDALLKEMELHPDPRMKVMPLPAHYPHGAEKVLVQVATGRRVPAGKIPSAVGCSVLNVSSLAVLQTFIETGMPLTTRRITVDGPAVETPTNLRVPIGTWVADILAFTGLKEEPAKVVAGGPMMGAAQIATTVPVTKQTNAILVFDKKNDLSEHHQSPCIRCGRCATACPMSLMPTLIERFAKINDVPSLQRVGVGVCMECGSCAYSCPAHRPLVQYMRLAKEIERKGRTQ